MAAYEIARLASCLVSLESGIFHASVLTACQDLRQYQCFLLILSRFYQTPITEGEPLRKYLADYPKLFLVESPTCYKLDW